MVAALELYFDPVAERRIRTLWTALEEVDVPSLRDHTHGRHRPHLSLVAADRLEPDAVVGALDGIAAAPPVSLSLRYVGQFVGRVLFLGPAPVGALLAHQEAVWRRLTAAGLELSQLYAPGTWVPHVTVSMRVPRPVLTEAVRRCLEVLPVEASIRSAAVADHARDILRPL
jgi:2'-5' RNA ligase superfamily protein